MGVCAYDFSYMALNSLFHFQLLLFWDFIEQDKMIKCDMISLFNFVNFEHNTSILGASITLSSAFGVHNGFSKILAEPVICCNMRKIG